MNKLSDGLDILCKNDEDASNLIMPRKEEIIILLERYIKEIETFNDAYGLVKVSNTDELITRHILDSLAPLGILYKLLSRTCSLLPAPCSLRIADAGSGAGLPGIPLAIAMTGFKHANFKLEFTLIERMERRAGFLHNTAGVLGQKNVTIQEKELERIESGSFDLITFRAFSPLEPKILKNLFRVCGKQGIIAAYKGQRAKIDQEIAGIGQYCSRSEIIQYNVPFLADQRHLVILYS